MLGFRTFLAESFRFAFHHADAIVLLSSEDSAVYGRKPNWVEPKRLLVEVGIRLAKTSPLRREVRVTDQPPPWQQGFDQFPSTGTLRIP